jgi:transcriptional regulator with XRE-family HTH domain
MAHNNQQLGRLMRSLRRQRNITGRELGNSVGMSQSKISKLENGLYPNPNFKEIERILNILNASKTLKQQIYRLLVTVRPGELRYQPYHDIHYTKVSYKRGLKTTSTRTFSPFIVPALLQTNEYRLAFLKSWNTTESDVDILKAIAQRQERLWDTQRNFHFIMHQAALYTSPLHEKRLDLPQFDRIERFMDLPHIKIGIIPLEAGMPIVPIGPFAILDERLLVASTVDGDLHSTNSKSIALHGRIFADLSRLAVYGPEAKRLIQLAIDFLGSD